VHLVRLLDRHAFSTAPGTVYWPEWRLIEPIAVFANDPDVEGSGHWRYMQMLGLGFDAAYVLEHRPDMVEPITYQRFDRFSDVLDTLSTAQLDALGLTPARRAILSEAFQLRVLLAAGDLQAARRIGAHWYPELREEFAVAPVGEAKIGRPIVRDHATLAKLCERALATFLYDPAEALGRVRQVLCETADRSGGPREPHETRSDHARRTAFASPASTLPTHKLPFGVVHPSMWPAVAERLGVTVDEARLRLCGPDEDAELDDDEAAHDQRLGPHALERELGDLLVHAIPVIPDDERPELYFPAPNRHAGITRVDDPVSALYKTLDAHIGRVEGLRHLALHANRIFDAATMELQRAVDELAIEASQPLDLTTIDGWGRRRAPRPVWLWNPKLDAGLPSEEPSDAPPSLVWLTEDRIAIARADLASIISLSQRRVVRAIAIGAASLQTCDDAGRLVVTTANSMQVYEGRFDGFGCFDAVTGVWLKELPDHIAAASFGKNQPEDGYLYEHRIGRSFECNECDRPTALAWSRGNRAVWLSGAYDSIDCYGVRSTQSCIEEITADALRARCEDVEVPVLRDDGALVDGRLVDDGGEPEPRERRRYAAAPCAFARTADSWHLLTPSLHIADLDQTWFRLGFAIDAAGFSADGRRLAVLDDKLRIIDLADRAIVWQAAFDEIS
jgi:hypothetical protein